MVTIDKNTVKIVALYLVCALVTMGLVAQLVLIIKFIF